MTKRQNSEERKEIIRQVLPFFQENDKGTCTEYLHYRNNTNTSVPLPAMSRVYQNFNGWRELKQACYTQLGRYLDRSNTDVPLAPQPKDPKYKTIKEIRPDGTYIEVSSLLIHTLDQALEVADVDLTKWVVDRHTINSWQVTMLVRDKDGIDEPVQRTNYQVKVWLKPKILNPIETAILELIKDMPKFIPYKIEIIDSPHALEMALYDSHIGKLAWSKETGQGDYDIPTARDIYLNSCRQCLNKSHGFNISQIFFILGQDLVHVENYKGVTPEGGNQLDVDSRVPKVYKEAYRTVFEALYMCRSIAPVHVIWVPGNHDQFASYAIACQVEEHFKSDPHVTVDLGEAWDKRIVWGKTLIGLTHNGDRSQVNVVNMLAQRWPKEWGESLYREIHCGHLHKKEVVKYKPVLTSGGVIIRRIPALSYIDKWHSDGRFIDAVPAGEAFLINKETGIEAHFTSNIKIGG